MSCYSRVHAAAVLQLVKEVLLALCHSSNAVAGKSLLAIKGCCSIWRHLSSLFKDSTRLEGRIAHTSVHMRPTELNLLATAGHLHPTQRNDR